MKKKLIVIILLVILLTVIGVIAINFFNNDSEPAWHTVMEWTGSEDINNVTFELTGSQNRIQYTIEEGSEQFIFMITDINGFPLTSFSTGIKKANDSISLNLSTGKYLLTVKSGNRKYILNLENYK